MVDKSVEAVANPARDGSAKAARLAYEQTIEEIFAECRGAPKADGLMTLMFTHKSQEAWEALTRSLIEAGWTNHGLVSRGVRIHGTYASKEHGLRQLDLSDLPSAWARWCMRGEIDLLVCTDAAAERLNSQSADLLGTFDLPWNPMKVEQRIGRIDRIGQRHRNISVLNLCYADSAEDIVYGRHSAPMT